MKVEFLYPKYYDLVFHVLAYFKVNNASNLYDENYIKKMEDEKNISNDIFTAVSSLENYYNENFERLMLINFLPYYCNDYNEMKTSFLTCNRFTQEDIHYFIKPFLELLDNESLFFFEYWEKLDNHYELLKKSTESNIERLLNKYSCIFNYFKKTCKVLFSYVITSNGRGFYSDTHFSALVRFPTNDDSYNFSFIQLLHEYTHSFTDSIINKEINMKDGSHDLSEIVVLLTDYYLIKAVDAAFILIYFDWLKISFKQCFDETKFLNEFTVDDNLRNEIIKLVDNILDSHA